MRLDRDLSGGHSTGKVILEMCFKEHLYTMQKKSRTLQTLNLSTNVDSSTNTIYIYFLFWGVFHIFFGGRPTKISLGVSKILDVCVYVRSLRASTAAAGTIGKDIG